MSIVSLECGELLRNRLGVLTTFWCLLSESVILALALVLGRVECEATIVLLESAGAVNR